MASNNVALKPFSEILFVLLFGFQKEIREGKIASVQHFQHTCKRALTITEVIESLGDVKEA